MLRDCGLVAAFESVPKQPSMLVHPSSVSCLGPTTQREFLLGMGLEARAKALCRADPSTAQDVLQAVAKLTGQGAMGDRFKCLAVVPRSTATTGIPGFKT